jgi:hypothetical protein
MEISNTQPTAPDGFKPHGYKNPTRLMAVASRKTGQLRRLIDDDDNTAYETIHETHVHPGEMVIYIDPNDYHSRTPEDFHDFIAQKVGHKKKPHWSTTRHALVSPRGEIMNIIEADPSCGDLGEHLAPGHTLLQHPTAERGMILFDNGKIGGLSGRNGAGDKNPPKPQV